MASRAAPLALEPDQFAFLFRGDQGIEADELGNFLRRAATVARRRGAELRVVGVERGSVIVVLKVVAKSAKNEFLKAPVATTASGTAIVGAVTAAIVFAMSSLHGPTPLAKAGAELVETKTVEEIQLVTINQTVVIMDEGRATELRAQEAERKLIEHEHGTPALPSFAEVRQLVDRGRAGSLSGEVHEAAGELVFRPAGFRYFVPIDLDASEVAAHLELGKEYRVTADILTHRGQPDRIIIHNATLI